MDSAKKRIEGILEKEGLQLSQNVIETVITISRGDMRKIINLFQNIHLQYSAAESDNKIELESGIGSECTSEDVYRLTGTLQPKKVREIFKSLMNDDLDESLKTVAEILNESDANIASILPLLTDLVIDEITGKKNKLLKLDILNILADIEKKAARDIPENLLKDYMISQFYIIRNQSE